MSSASSPRSSHRPSGWSLAAMGVALTPARVFTSHLRRHYHRRYKGRVRYAPFVFGLDFCLFILAATLVIANIILFVVPPARAPGIGLTFLAPSIVSGSPVALEARLTSQDGKVYEDVRLTWDVPPGAEILFADPPLTSTNEARVGRIDPNEPKVARIALRVFTPPGSVPFGFKVTSGFKSFSGQETRSVIGSALVFKPMIQTESLPVDADIPFLLKNSSNKILDTVEISVLGGGLVEGRDRLLIGDLAPGASRAILIHTEDKEGLLNIIASSRGVPLVSISSSIEQRNPSLIQKVSIRSNPRLKQLTVESEVGGAGHLLVYHPALVDSEDGFKMISVQPKVGIQRFTLLLADGATPVDRWFVLPFEEYLGRRPSGTVFFGDLVQERTAQGLSVSIQGRYYAVNGDQLGIGPLPPRVGEATKYWIFWQLPPRGADYRDVRLQASLAPGVRLTGREALPQGGALSQTSNGVVWTMPFLSTDLGPVTVGFEVIFTPTEKMRGQVQPLIIDASSQGVDARTGTAAEIQDGMIDTALVDDKKSEGKGRVE